MTSPPRTDPAASTPVLALGLDAGGTQTRWALATASCELVAEGAVAGLSAAMQATPAGQQQLHHTLAALAKQVLGAGRPVQVHAGITGYGGGAQTALAGWIARPLGLAADSVSLVSDVEVAFLDLFEPGQGYLVYAGTGSIGAFVDEQGGFHRVGGRGGLLDDGGSGFWIAREALRRIWRTEDEQPGAWQHSVLAREVLEHVGGADWSHTRRFITTADRGEMGRLALAVATAAATDREALRILQQAGDELGRLARILTQRHGQRPVALAGRVFQLHPVIEQACRAALGPAHAAASAAVPPSVQVRISRGHHAAARIAARRLRGAARPSARPEEPPCG